MTRMTLSTSVLDLLAGGASDAGRAASGGVTVDVDLTFVGQIVLFALLFLLLKPMLFDPMLKLFEERERRTAGAKDEARAMYKEADAIVAEYEVELEKVKRQAGEERDKLRAEGQRREQQILAKVRSETNAMVDEGREKLAKDAATLRAELAVTANELAKEMASRVLGREV
jgi:F-type H+-transporting ATPase subunit b